MLDRKDRFMIDNTFFFLVYARIARIMLTFCWLRGFKHWKSWAKRFLDIYFRIRNWQMVIFSNNNPAFFLWIHNNQKGYVLNTNNTTLAKIHRATCTTFKTTENGFTKYCSLDVDELIQFVESKPAKFVNGYGDCRYC